MALAVWKNHLTKTYIEVLKLNKLNHAEKTKISLLN